MCGKAHRNHPKQYLITAMHECCSRYHMDYLVRLKLTGGYIYADLSLHDCVAEELDILETPKISKEAKQAIDGGDVHRDKHGQSEKQIGLCVNLRPIRFRGVAIQSEDLLLQQKSGSYWWQYDRNGNRKSKRRLSESETHLRIRPCGHICAKMWPHGMTIVRDSDC